MKYEELIKNIVKVLDEKKAEDIKVIDISKLSVIADYFLIANGNSTSQVNALVDNVEEQKDLVDELYESLIKQ